MRRGCAQGVDGCSQITMGGSDAGRTRRKCGQSAAMDVAAVGRE